MKKFLVLLLISILAIFVFAGCTTPPVNGGDDPGNGDEVEGVTVEISDSVKINGIDYVKGDNRDKDGKLIGNTITVTFPAPVEGMVQAEISDCTTTTAATKFLFPNEDRTVWTGTVDFDCKSMFVADPCSEDYTCDACGECDDLPCCETVITIISGACDVDECIVLPVIVDCAPPAIPEFKFECFDCDECETVCEPQGAYFTFTSVGGDICDPSDACKDDCSGVDSWKFYVGDDCDMCVLYEGTGCPIEGTADCGCLPWVTPLEVALNGADYKKEYTVTFEITDKVGNKATQEYTMKVDTDSVVSCLAPVEEEV
ncbi:MAG: hypothetical protein PHQ99_08615 [Atribacterota bacterium]|nr:hypothetical protein [Atribacterota bacterium]